MFLEKIHKIVSSQRIVTTVHFLGKNENRSRYHYPVTTAMATTEFETTPLISCEVLRGPIQSDGSRTSLALVTARIENHPPTTQSYPPLRDVTGIKTIHLLADYHTIPQIRSVLCDLTTPTPDSTGYQFKCHWNGDQYARSNPDHLTSNSTGKVMPVFESFRLSSLIPPPDTEGEVTVAFITQCPSAYNPHDRLPHKTAVMTDQFQKLQQQSSTRHVILYIHTNVLQTYTNLIPSFDTYWKEVIPMDHCQYFINDFLGKKTVGEVKQVVGTLRANTSFYSTFLLPKPLATYPSFDPIKTRGVSVASSSYSAIDVGTKSLVAGNRLLVCVNDPVADPFTAVSFTLNDVTYQAEGIEVQLEKSDVLIQAIVLYEQTTVLKHHTERMAWIHTNEAFVTSFQFHSMTKPFMTMTHDSLSVMAAVDHLCDTIQPILYSLIQESNTTEYLDQIELRRKHVYQKTGAYEPYPPKPPKLTALVPCMSMPQ